MFKINFAKRIITAPEHWTDRAVYSQCKDAFMNDIEVLKHPWMWNNDNEILEEGDDFVITKDSISLKLPWVIERVYVSPTEEELCAST